LTTVLPPPPPRAKRTLLVVGLVVGLLGAGTGAVLLTGPDGRSAVSAAPASPVQPVTAVVVGARKGSVAWQRPLVLKITHGSIDELTVRGPRGVVPGVLAEQTWTSNAGTIPGGRYVFTAKVLGEDGRVSAITRSVRATDAKQTLRATFSPTGGTYGVGQPLIARFNHKVRGVEARRAVLRGLKVTTSPAVTGAWRWYNSFEAHYRPQAYWKPGTKITVTGSLVGVKLPGTSTWGGVSKPGGFSIGRSMISTVDLKTHLMTVKRDGKVVRVMRISGGKPAYPTKGGVHIVLTRERKHLFNSATVGIPVDSREGYYLTLPYAVRITNSGTFVHAQPATVRHQGRRNVSHGCINASTADARWFYESSLLGDVVNVVNAVVPPKRMDAGAADWNYRWADWRAGNLDG
jgi:lipoprotein-anchoring transpeptidase ErfK/SrfK